MNTKTEPQSKTPSWRWILPTCLLEGPALVLLIVFFVGLGLHNHGKVLYFFGSLGRSALVLCWILILILEGLEIIVIAENRKQGRWLLIELVLLPCLTFASFGYLVDGTTSYEREVPEFKTTLVISNWSFLLLGSSNIYQKESAFSARYLASADGDDGAEPLEDERFYALDAYAHGICITYDNGTGSGKPSYLYLQYADGLFVSASSLSEVQ